MLYSTKDSGWLNSAFIITIKHHFICKIKFGLKVTQTNKEVTALFATKNKVLKKYISFVRAWQQNSSVKASRFVTLKLEHQHSMNSYFSLENGVKMTLKRRLTTTLAYNYMRIFILGNFYLKNPT